MVAELGTHRRNSVRLRRNLFQELISLTPVDIPGHQRGFFCIVPTDFGKSDDYLRFSTVGEISTQVLVQIPCQEGGRNKGKKCRKPGLNLLR